jgi:hypothetical protein
MNLSDPAVLVRTLHLEEVSTVRGSGWVNDQHVVFPMILNSQPLPTRYREVVLTVSNKNLGLEARRLWHRK